MSGARLVKGISAQTRCRQIARVLAPTMRGARPDSVACLIPAATLQRVYELASAGAKAKL